MASNIDSWVQQQYGTIELSTWNCSGNSAKSITQDPLTPVEYLVVLCKNLSTPPPLLEMVLKLLLIKLIIMANPAPLLATNGVVDHRTAGISGGDTAIRNLSVAKTAKGYGSAVAASLSLQRNAYDPAGVAYSWR